MTTRPDNFDSSEQDRCRCGEFPWGTEECAICGAWLSEHKDLGFAHAPVPGDGRSAHPTCFAAYWLALPYVPEP